MKYFTTAMFGLALMTSAAVAAPSMVTSASLRAKTACDLIKKPDLLAKLTVPENTHVSFRTANGDDILHASWGVSAFIDLNNDGKLDALLHVASMTVPRVDTPVFVYPADYPMRGATQYGWSNDGKNEILVVSNTFVAGENADNALNVINRISFDGRTLKKQEPYHKSAQSGGTFSPYDLDICDGKLYWFASATGRYVEIQKNQN